MRGIYIHIPFCLRKCPYCDFYSVRFDEKTAEEYTDALIRSFKLPKYKGLRADTVYFGGGTPSALPSELTGRIMQAVFECFDIDKNAEITIEANPCTVDERKLSAYREMGINRISFGVQSADDRELMSLGRLHDSETAQRAILSAHKAGFENISADIMLGVIGQDKQSLIRSADRLAELPLTHISAYMLKIEQGTPYDNDRVRATVADEDTVSDMYIELCERLEQKGFLHYEISNFARPGFESRHNLKYWTAGEYVGFGTAAHSLYMGRRYYVPKDIAAFIDAPFQQEIPEEEPHSEREEYIMLALRVSEGLDEKKLISLYGEEGTGRLMLLAKTYEKHGLCCISGSRVSLTPRGYLVSNTIIVEFLHAVGLA